MAETPRLPIWLLPLLAILCSAGMWTYANRVLIPDQMADARSHAKPRGNLSDLYPRWVGARELLLHSRDPYSAEVTREIQAGYYGRPLDPSRPDDPRDQDGFAYPLYVVFCLAPTIGLPFAIVQKGFFWILVIVTSASTLLWLRVLRWYTPASTLTKIGLLALVLGSLGIVQGLKLQQISLLVAAMIALAIVLLSADYAVAAGVLLALATVKPQLVALLLFWLSVWTLADWQRRYRWAVSFLATMAFLLAASEWYLPHWIFRFWQAVGEYRQYSGGRSVLDNLVGPPTSWVLEAIALVAMLVTCYGERGTEANTRAFAFTVSLVLALTVLLLSISAPYNQVLLIPALLLLLKERRTIWQSSGAARVLFLITAVLIVWPWVSSLVLAVLSFVSPQEKIDQASAVPFWTVTLIPVGVVGLMLVICSQRISTVAAGWAPRSGGNAG